MNVSNYDIFEFHKFTLFRVVCGKLLILDHYVSTEYWLNGNWHNLSESLVDIWFEYHKKYQDG